MSSVTAELLKVKPTIRCRVLERVNRFVVKVSIGDRVLKAYLCNTGRLLDYLGKGREGFCTELVSPSKLRYRLFAVRDDELGAIIDTHLQLKAFERAMNFIPWLKMCRTLRRNVRVGGSLLDYLLECDGEKVFLEVKSAVLRIGNYASYPDCPSIRARKQIKDLIKAAEKGYRGIILFIAALPNVSAFKPNFQADQELSALLLTAKDRGIEIRAIAMAYDPVKSSIYLSDPELEVEL